MEKRACAGGGEKPPALAARWERPNCSHGHPKAVGDGLFDLFVCSDARRHERERRIVEDIRPMPNGESHARRLQTPFCGDHAALLVVVPKPQPAAFECRRHVTLELGKSRQIIMGEIVYAHYRDGVVDPERLHVDPAMVDAIARLGGDTCSTIRDRFEMLTPKL